MPDTIKRTTGVTIGEAGAGSFGRPPIGPLSPGFGEIRGTMEGVWINLLQRFNWRGEIEFHRPHGRMPNLAPAGFAFVGRAQSTVPRRGNLRPMVPAGAPNFGPFWIGTGE